MFKRSRAAIDIGDHSVKVIEYEPTSGGVVINRAYTLEGVDQLGSVGPKTVLVTLSSIDSIFVENGKSKKELKASI